MNEKKYRIIFTYVWSFVCHLIYCSTLEFRSFSSSRGSPKAVSWAWQKWNLLKNVSCVTTSQVYVTPVKKKLPFFIYRYIFIKILVNKIIMKIWKYGQFCFYRFVQVCFFATVFFSIKWINKIKILHHCLHYLFSLSQFSFKAFTFLCIWLCFLMGSLRCNFV